MTARTIMVMGTSSSAGKSLIAAALCRCLARQGFQVAPFKSQNMSNNAAVCPGGGEIGRSQALQAVAARVAPHTDMNPILMKPEAQGRSQIVVNGRPIERLDTNDYFDRRQQLWKHATAALDRLRTDYDVVVIEGAGSPAELNLADVEIVNMAVAHYCDSPVILVGDIERGGVFAQLLGTLSLLPADDRKRIRGLIVNKFHGELALFKTGVEIIEQRGGVPVLGVLPWIDSLDLPEEDAVALDHNNKITPAIEAAQLDIAVIQFPHIANFDDFDPLKAESNVGVRFVRSLAELGRPDVIILPGTKSTIADLNWLRNTGIAAEVKRLAKQAETALSVVGICGGYQMLGHMIHNPDRIESQQDCTEGLGLIPVTTTFRSQKQTANSRFRITNDVVAPGTLHQTLTGYEIHHGQTESNSGWLTREELDANRPTTDNASTEIGGCAPDGRIWGCYLHGIFHNDIFRRRWLQQFEIVADSGGSSTELLDRSLERLADSFESYIDFHTIMELIHSPTRVSRDIADD